MPKSHARYASEYRHRMVELVRAGRSPDELAKEFEPTARMRKTKAPASSSIRATGLAKQQAKKADKTKLPVRTAYRERIGRTGPAAALSWARRHSARACYDDGETEASGSCSPI
jgi:transposase